MLRLEKLDQVTNRSAIRVADFQSLLVSDMIGDIGAVCSKDKSFIGFEKILL